MKGDRKGQPPPTTPARVAAVGMKMPWGPLVPVKRPWPTSAEVQTSHPHGSLPQMQAKSCDLSALRFYA